MHLNAAHVEEAREHPLLKADLFDSAKLEVGGRATEKTALEYQSVVRDGDLRRSDWNHHREKYDAPYCAGRRSNQMQSLRIKSADCNQRQEKHEPSEGSNDEGHPRPVVHDLVRPETLFDITHAKPLPVQ